MRILGAWIRSERLHKRMDIKDLSSKVGLTSAQISRIETLNSDITVNSIVRIAYGLNLTLIDVMAELELLAFFPRLRGTGLTDANKDIATMQDIEAFLGFYRSEPREAKDQLIDAYRIIRENKPNQQEEKLAEYHTADIIWQATQAHSQKYLPLPYPREVKEELIEEIYISGGVITIRDFAAYIMACRLSSGQSLTKLAKQIDISHHAVGRLERGELERISFTEIIALDKVLELDGRLIAICWVAGEFQAGITRIRALEISDATLTSVWNPEELAFADTLITITRWNSVLSVNPGWFEKLRKDNLSYYYS